MWNWRRVTKTNWTNRKSKDIELLKQIKEEKEFTNMIEKDRLHFLENLIGLILSL